MSANASAHLDRFSIPLEVTIRRCREDDLAALEWFGLFREHCEIIRSTYQRQDQGSVAMLIAELTGFPVGQVWIDFTGADSDATGLLWAVRVFPFLRSQGIGGRLVAAAEQVLCREGFACAELGVERDNPDARRFYESLGYQTVRTERGAYSYTTPEGEKLCIPTDEWILQKCLQPADVG